MPISDIFFFLARTLEGSLSFLLPLLVLLLLNIFTLPIIRDMLLSKFRILFFFESSHPSSKSTLSMLTLLVSGLTSVPLGTLDNGVHAYSLVAIMLEYILSNLNFKDGSILAYLNFLAPLIFYIKEMKIINATSCINNIYEI